jgi:hypothetical protein
MRLMNGPEGRTRLVPGRYTMIVTGPAGVVMSLAVDLASRTTVDGTIDDERLQELLVVTSVASGVVEGELHHAQRMAGDDDLKVSSSPSLQVSSSPSLQVSQSVEGGGL